MTRVQALFLSAITAWSALVVLGASVILGRDVAVGVGVGLGGLVLVLAARARAAVAARRREAGRTCTCCTTSHFDPVKVV